MKMTVKDLRKALEKELDDTPIVFQGNTKSEYDNEEDDIYSHTESYGHVFQTFNNGTSFVLDCAITEHE